MLHRGFRRRNAGVTTNGFNRITTHLATHVTGQLSQLAVVHFEQPVGLIEIMIIVTDRKYCFAGCFQQWQQLAVE